MKPLDPRIKVLFRDRWPAVKRGVVRSEYRNREAYQSEVNYRRYLLIRQIKRECAL